MTTTDISNIANLAVVGHGGAGKTTLVEAMLYVSGVTSRLGSVDEGTSICDHLPEEKERDISISSAIVHCDWQGRRLNIVDTPGYPDFIGEAIGALRAVESVLVAVSAAAGVQLNTRKLWARAEEEGLPRALVVTKLDSENISFQQVLEGIRTAFGAHCLPVNLPVGVGPGISEVVDVLNPPAEVDASLASELEAAREQLIEGALEADDALLEKYLEGGELSQEEIKGCLASAFHSGKLVPVFATAARQEVGVKALLDGLVGLAPSPLEIPARTYQENDEVIPIDPQASDGFMAQVFKTLTDPFVGKLSFFRVYSGALSADGSVHISRMGKSYRVGQLFRLQGDKQELLDRVVAGDIAAISKVEDIATSDTLTDGKLKGALSSISFPTPMVSLAVEPRRVADEQKISSSLTKLAEEDPTFRLTRDQQTREMVITGMSPLHLDIALEKLARRFEVEVNSRPPKIPYRETVTAKAEGHWRHKKQTGGRGQFGEVFIRVEPLNRGEGFEFVNEIVQGRVPSQYIPAVEKGVRKALLRGVIGGYPCDDLRVILYDGKFHPVDSSEESFKIAGARAFQEATSHAQPVLLEPIVNVEISVPSQFMGEVTGDLNSRRGRIQGMESLGDLQIIKAQIPLAELSDYVSELRSITGGEGSYTFEFSHYGSVPRRVSEAIISQAKKPEQA